MSEFCSWAAQQGTEGAEALRLGDDIKAGFLTLSTGGRACRHRKWPPPRAASDFAGQRERLASLEMRAFFTGEIRRSEIEARFGIKLRLRPEI
jgi:hypothetical protein